MIKNRASWKVSMLLLGTDVLSSARCNNVLYIRGVDEDTEM